jgi:transcriptional regulator with XRE-family HTH domain
MLTMLEQEVADPASVTGDQLSAWRVRMDLTRLGAAEMLGCSRGAFTRWEKGEQPVPRYIGLACVTLETARVILGRKPDHEEHDDDA